MKDKKGTLIKEGDLIKVYHFTSSRQNHYLYFVVGLVESGSLMGKLAVFVPQELLRKNFKHQCLLQNVGDPEEIEILTVDFWDRMKRKKDSTTKEDWIEKALRVAEEEFKIKGEG